MEKSEGVKWTHMALVELAMNLGVL